MYLNVFKSEQCGDYFVYRFTKLEVFTLNKTKAVLLLTVVISLIFCLSSCNANAPYVSALQIADVTSADIVPIESPDFSDVIKNVSFIGCGDNIIYAGNIKDARSKALPGGRQYNFKPMYENVADIIESADIAFINQENVMCGEGYEISYYPMFNSPQELGYDLQELGYDVVNIANNHMLDKDSAGLEKTIEFWKNMDGVLMIGGYENEEDYDNLRILESNGIKIAFLSYTYGTNGLTKSASSDVVIPYIDDEDIIRQTANAKQNADVVLVSVHWGYEGAFTPNSEQKRVAKLFADCGVDAIIGHHPHVLQPVEWIEGKDGNRTLCVYSLGNFMAEQAYDYNMVGGIISFDIVQIADAEPYIDNVLFTPTVFHFPSNFYNNTIYLMEDYTPELAAVHGVRTFYKHTLTYDRLIEYATDTIDEQFLPEFLKGDSE